MPPQKSKSASHRLLNPLTVRGEMPSAFKGAVANPRALASPGETAETAALKSAIWKLAEVRDEQLYVALGRAMWQELWLVPCWLLPGPLQCKPQPPSFSLHGHGMD